MDDPFAGDVDTTTAPVASAPSGDPFAGDADTTSPNYVPAPSVPYAKPTIGSVAKQFALGIPRGIADVAGSVWDAVTGKYVSYPLLSQAKSPEEFKQNIPAPAGEAIKSAVGLEGTNAPQNAPERIASGVGSGVAMAPMGGAEGLIGSGIVGGIAGGGGAAAQELVPDKYKPAAGFLGSLITGVGASGVAGAASGAKQIVSKAAEPLTASGQETAAGRILLQRAEDPDTFKATLNTANPNIVPGSNPTTFQLTGDMGIGSLERETAAKNRTTFNDLRAEQNEARVNYISDIQQTGSPEAIPAVLQSQLRQIDSSTQNAVDAATQDAQNRASTLGGEQTPENYGNQLRASLVSAENSARANERSLWNAVDPDGTLTATTTPVKSAISRVYGRLSAAAESSLTPVEKQIQDVVGGYNSIEPFQEITDLRSLVSSAMRQEIGANGRTPAYARLTQLRGAIEDSINGTISDQAASDTRAVASGAMPAENTLADRLQSWVNDFRQSRASAVGDTTSSISGPGGGETPSTSIPGTASPSRGSPPGTTSTEGLSPTFDPDAYARLRAASSATQQRAQTFGQGPPEKILDRYGSQGPYKLQDSLVPSKVFHPGANGAQDVQAYRNAVGDDAALPVLSDYAASSARQASIGPNGMVDPVKFAAWQAKHSEALRAFPQLRERFSDAGRATQSIADIAAVRKSALEDAQQGVLGKLMGVTDPSDVVKTVGSIFGSKNAVAQMRNLVAQIRENQTAHGLYQSIRGPDAMQGLRKAIVDHITSKLISNTEGGTTGQALLKSDQFQTFMKQNEPALREVFSDSEVNSMKAVADDLFRANRSLTATKDPAGPSTAQDLMAGGKRGIVSSLLTKIVGAAIGGHIGGIHGAIEGYGGVALANSLKESGITKVDQLVKDALLDPEKAKAFIQKVPPGKESHIASILARRLAMVSMYSGNQAVQRARGGRVNPANINHSPTPAQAESGNYKKDGIHLHGLRITIENAKGSTRKGIGKDGKPWSCVLPAHYGYIRGTEGSDSDHVDCYIGPYPKAKKVWVVDQKNADTNAHDEHKIMIGFASRSAVISAYHAAFSDGRAGERLGKITELSIDGLKDWLKHGNLKKPLRRASGGRVGFADGGVLPVDTSTQIDYQSPQVDPGYTHKTWVNPIPKGGLIDAITGAGATDPSGDKSLFGDIIGGIKSGLTAPADAMSGAIQSPFTNPYAKGPVSSDVVPEDELIQRSQDMAALGGVGMIGGAERGALDSVGRAAQTANRLMPMQKAQAQSRAMIQGKLLSDTSEPGMALSALEKSGKILPPSEDINTVMDSNFMYPKLVGDTTVPIDSLKGGVRMDDPQEVTRVGSLAKQIQSPDGYFSRPIVDSEGNVLEGQHRLEALRQMGEQNVPVTVVKDLSSGYDTNAMKQAITSTGKIHPDQVNGIVREALHSVDEYGSPEKALSETEMPAPFTNAYRAALNSLKSDTSEPGMALSGAEKPSIRAFHGSPHDFDQFSTENIGTGEGAQSYGHGLYFAENPITAKSYQDALSRDTFTINGKPVNMPGLSPELRQAVKVIDEYGSPEKAKQHFSEIPGSEVPRWIDEAQKRGLGSYKGRMYEVNINADPEHFLDWDAPLGQQPHILKNAPQLLDSAKEEAYSRALSATNKSRADQLWRMVKDPTQAPGEFALRALKGQASIISKSLDDAGVPGIKYFDHGSRDGGGRGTRNYVVFNHKHVNIVNKRKLGGRVNAINDENGTKMKQRQQGGAINAAKNIRRGYADGGAPDTPDVPIDSTPDTATMRALIMRQALKGGNFNQDYSPLQTAGAASKAVGNVVAPNLTSYLTEPPPPLQNVPSTPGKVPPTTDPRFPGAVSDVGNIAETALTAAVPELGAARLAESATPTIGRAVASAAPTGMRDIASIMANAGPLAAPAAASALVPSSAQAQEGNLPVIGKTNRPTATDDEIHNVADINHQIVDLNRQRMLATKGIGPKGAAIAAAPFDQQISRLNDQISTINGQVTARQNEWDKQQEEYEKQTAPFAQQHPDITQAARVAGLGLSPATGAWLGRKIGAAFPGMSPAKRLITYGSAAAGGALEGGIGAYLPTLEDVGMPEGSQAKTQADIHNDDPRFWRLNVLPEAGAGAAASMLGAKYGLTSALRPSQAISAAKGIARSTKAATMPLRDSSGRFVSRSSNP